MSVDALELARDAGAMVGYDPAEPGPPWVVDVTDDGRAWAEFGASLLTGPPAPPADDGPACDPPPPARCSTCWPYRYALARRWARDHPVLPVIMLNPSTADAFVLDPTIRRCVGFAREWGYGGVLVLNLYALRSTDPRALRRHRDPEGPANNDRIRRWLAAAAEGWGDDGDALVAWGAWAAPGRARDVLGMIRSAGLRPVCLGRTRTGQPRHPLYVHSATRPEEL